MKKLVLVLSIVSMALTGMSQNKMTAEEARSICAREMAAFTRSVSGVYKKGMTLLEFKNVLCGQAKPSKQGVDQITVAYNFLVKGVSSDVIAQTYNGKEVAAVLNYLYNENQKGVQSDGSEVFGGKTGSSNNELSKTAEGGCRWYQIWCHLQPFANWVVQNWPVIQQILIYILSI